MDQLCISMLSYLQGGWVTEVRARTGNIKSISLMVACMGSDAVQNALNFKNIQFWRPAVTDPHKVRSCNCTGRSPSHIGIDSEWFSPVSISRLEIWPFDGTPSEYDILTRKLPDFNEIVPKFDRLLWISCACPCLHIYSVDRWRKLGRAQEI